MATSLNAYEYGAVGDGVNDDTGAIQAALNDASDATGRRVVLNSGTFRVTNTLTATGAIAISGEGPERTVIVPEHSSTVLRVGSKTPGQSQPHGLMLSDFTIRGDQSTGYPMIDVQQYGRKWTIERVHLDNQHYDRPGIRLWTSWVGSIRDCNFHRFGYEGVASNRATIIVKPQRLDPENPVTSNGPINNVLIDACAFERVQTAIDLHDPNESKTSTSIYSVEIRNPRFKNSDVNGYTPNSVGIRSGHNGVGGNNTFNVLVSTPFFEDFAIGMQVRGWGWAIESPFVQSAEIGIELVSGGAHSIRGLIVQGSEGNSIGIGVAVRSGVTGACELVFPKSVGAAGFLDAMSLDDSVGNNKLVVTLP